MTLQTGSDCAKLTPVSIMARRGVVSSLSRIDCNPTVMSSRTNPLCMAPSMSIFGIVPVDDLPVIGARNTCPTQTISTANDMIILNPSECIHASSFLGHSSLTGFSFL